MSNLKEIQCQLPIAEDIARLRFEATSILTTSPRSNWDSSYRTLLDKYPTLEEYRKIFDLVFSRIKNAHDSIDEIWKYFQPDEYAKDPITQKMEVASSEASSAMFEGFFEEKATKKVRVERGVTTLRFIADDEDFKKIRNTTNEKGDIITDATSMEGIDDEIAYSILAFRSYYDNEMPKKITHTLHEAEHGFSAILQYRYKLLQSEGLDMKPTLVNRLRRGLNEYEESDIHIAREELLALFTEFEIYSVPVEKYGDFDEKIHNSGSIYIPTLLGGLPNPEDPSYSEHINDPKNYTNLVKNGARAFLDLYDLYKVEFREGKTEIDPSRMTINVLEQFPLRSWSAVAKLISSRRKTIKSQSGNELKPQSYSWKYLFNT